MMHLVIRGCCPGQTGHHIFPDAWGKALQKNKACKKYTSGGAPTVCVEGTGRHHGSHGEIHTEMDCLVRIFKDSKKDTIPVSTRRNKASAIAMAADSFHNSIGGHCNRRCTVAQLKHYYKDQAECSGEIQPTEGHEESKSGNRSNNGDFD